MQLFFSRLTVCLAVFMIFGVCKGEEVSSQLELFVVHPNARALLLTGDEDPRVKRILTDYRVMGGGINRTVISKRPIFKITEIESVLLMSNGSRTLQVALKIPRKFENEVQDVRLNPTSGVLCLVLNNKKILGKVLTPSLSSDSMQIRFGKFSYQEAEEMVERIDKLKLTAQEDAE